METNQKILTTGLRITFFLVACALILSLSSCKKDADEPVLSGAEKNTLLLVSTPWSMQSVQVDGTDQSGLFSGLSISFTSTGFTASNGEPVWPASGSWSFADNSGNIMNRSDGITISVTDITSSSLKLTLTWDRTTIGPGRTASVKGTHVFLFGK